MHLIIMLINRHDMSYGGMGSKLILGQAPGTAGAANRLHVAEALVGPTVILVFGHYSFLGHLGSAEAREVLLHSLSS